MKDAIEFIGDCCFALSLFVEYMLYEAYSFVWRLAVTFWIVVVLASTAHAGGYCNTCNAYVQREVAYTPQTIIQHQNNEIFYQIPNYVGQYAATPSALTLAKLGELERADQQMRDRIAEYKATLVQPQQYAQQQVVYCVPVQAQAQAAYCPPGTVPAQQPAAQPQQPMPQPTQPGAPATPPQTFSDRAPQSIIQAACLKCHGGASVKGELDFNKDLTCEQKQKALVKVSMGEMPKGGPHLTAEQFMQLAKELTALKTVGASTGEAPAE